MPVRVGDVLHAYVAAFGKDKFFVIVCALDPVRVAFINTKNRADVLNDASLTATQVAITPLDLPCLKHDSWVSCLELRGWPEDVENIVKAGGIRGSVPDRLLAQILIAIDQSPTISGRQKSRCVAAIKDKLNIT